MAKVREYRCCNCSNVQEQINWSAEEPEVVQCERCGAAATRCPSTVLGKTIVRGNSDYAERERARLTKRSNDHFRRQGKDEAIERERAQFKREGIIQ